MSQRKERKCKHCHNLPAVWQGYCISCWNESKNNMQIDYAHTENNIHKRRLKTKNENKKKAVK